MQPRAEWMTAIKRQNGKLLYWLMQGEDQNVQTKTPAGVCHALTFSWIKGERGSSSSRIAFSKQFSGSPTAEIRIPQEYITEQLDYHLKMKVAKIYAKLMTRQALALNREYDALARKAKSDPTDANTMAAETANAKAEAAFNTLKEHVRTTQGGPDCLFHKTFDTDKPMFDVLTYVEEKKYAAEKPSTFGDDVFVALAMTNGTDDGSNLGHVVGIHITTFIELFDANIGLVQFTRFPDFKSFLNQEVWGDFYMKLYDTPALYLFDCGLRGATSDKEEKKKASDRSATPEERKERLTEQAALSEKNSPCLIM